MASKPTPQPSPAKAKPTAPDPVTVDPKHYTVELENEKVRVLRIKYGPREGCLLLLSFLIFILGGCRPVTVEKRLWEHLNYDSVSPHIHLTSPSLSFPEQLKVGWIGYLDDNDTKIIPDDCYTALAMDPEHIDNDRPYQLDRTLGRPVAIEIELRTATPTPPPAPQEAGHTPQLDFRLTVPPKSGSRRVVQLSVVGDRQLFDEDAFPRVAKAQTRDCYEKLVGQPQRHKFIIVEVLRGRLRQTYFYRQGPAAVEPVRLVITASSPGQPPISSPQKTPPPNPTFPRRPAESQRLLADSPKQATKEEIITPISQQELSPESVWEREGEHQNTIRLKKPLYLGFTAKWINLGPIQKGDASGLGRRELTLGKYVRFPWVGIKILKHSVAGDNGQQP
jgi:hypothetical protein